MFCKQSHGPQIPYTRMQQFGCHNMPHAKWVTHTSMQQWTHCFTCRTQTDSLLQQFVIVTAGVKQRLQHGMQAWLAAIQSVSLCQGSTHAAMIHGAPHLHGVGFCSVKECVRCRPGKLTPCCLSSCLQRVPPVTTNLNLVLSLV